MKTEKTLKAKKITLLFAVVAIAAVAITLTAVLLPKYKVTKASTGNEKKTAEIERTISQIESLEAEYQKSFDENAARYKGDFSDCTRDCAKNDYPGEIPLDFLRTFLTRTAQPPKEEK